MGIERMSYVEFSGPSRCLDDVLERCLKSGRFHPENAAKLSVYSIGASPLMRNPYEGLILKISELAGWLKIDPAPRDFSGLDIGQESREQFIEQAHEYLDRLRETCPPSLRPPESADGEAADFLSRDTDALITLYRESRERFIDQAHEYFDRANETDRQSQDAADDIEIDAFLSRETETLLTLYSRTKFLHDAYDLRRYVVEFRGAFHFVGFIPAKGSEEFFSLFGDLEIKTQSWPDAADHRFNTPVMLKNNWFTRPFEMFVQMYGTPSYSDIDPTPFVAYTYCLLFGAMFGDLGQGLFVLLLGLFLSRVKNMALGGIMSRIGASSAFFGVLYGSVFGFEHLLDPFFHAIGLHEKPIEVMRPEATEVILLASVGLGVALIIMVIVFNMAIGAKHRSIERTLFSQNGLAGLVLYLAALVAIVASIALGINLISAPYIVIFFVLPVLCMFFREPISHILKLRDNSALIHRDKALLEHTVFKAGDMNIASLLTARFIAARFGRIPTDSYQKLDFYRNMPFVAYTIKTNNQYTWIVYAMTATDEAQVDAIFRDLFFERVEIPEQSLCSNEQAEVFVKACVDGNCIVPNTVNAADIPHSQSLRQVLFPEGVGSFVLETFFEMFEILLSFVTNTMSFLRVGGFILSHAGMMSVVMTLSSMVDAGASPVVIIIGNLFVMGLEGLIVGIQCLRLEFYEMFSRYFDAQGTPFTPAKINT